MIGYLRGEVVDRSGNEWIIDVAGVGYVVTMAGHQRPAIDDAHQVRVHVHHHVRDDAETLFGFADIAERRLFESLLSAHGVGPSLAAAILSVHAPAALALAVATDDVNALCAVPGVGKKTAARLLLELKNSLVVESLPAPAAATGAAATTTGSTVIDDVRLALSELGYSADEITRAVKGLPADGESGDVLRRALSALA